jgi:hypothetical protein
MKIFEMRPSIWSTAAILLCLCSLLSTSVAPQPFDSDFGMIEGTRSVSWLLNSTNVIILDNTKLVPSGATLSTYETGWLSDSYADFIGGSQISNIQVTGGLQLDVNEYAEMISNGDFTEPDDGDPNNYLDWAYTKSGNYTAELESRWASMGFWDNGYCWRNWHVDSNNGGGYSMSVWLNQTINITSMPTWFQIQAQHRFENNSHSATPGVNASMLLTNLTTGDSVLLASTGWYNQTDSAYDTLQSSNVIGITGPGLYNVSLLSEFDTTGNPAEVNHLGTPGLYDYWDNASMLLSAHYPTGNYVSNVFDAGSYVMWNNVTWDEVKPLGTNVEVFVRTGNSSVPTDSIWSGWSPAITNSSGSAINRPWGRYLQYRIQMATSNTSITPELYNFNVTYGKFISDGYFETGDYRPANIVRWGVFHLDCNAYGQTVVARYSTDSGLHWQDIPSDMDLRDVDVDTPSGIRFRIVLNTQDSIVSPIVQLISMSYVSLAPSFTLEPVWTSKGASPGDIVRLRIYFNNTANSLSSTAWLNVYLDVNLEYLANNSQSLPILSDWMTDSNSGIRKFIFSSIPLGQNTFWIEARVKSGVIDGDIMQNTVTLDYMDPLGNRVESILSLAPLRANGPVITAGLSLQNSSTDIGEPVHCILYLNNTGHGTAPKVWVNGSIDDRLESSASSWILTDFTGNSSQIIEFNVTLSDNVGQGSQVPMSFSVAYCDSSGHVSETDSGSAIVDAALRSRFSLEITSQSGTVNSSEMVVLTIHFNNTGFGSAQILKFNMTIPYGLEFVSSSQECILYAERCYWERQNVGPGQHSFTVTMRADKLDNDISNILVVVYMQVIDPIDGTIPITVSNFQPISIVRIYTFQEKIYWPWSGLAIVIGTSFAAFSLWHFFKPIPPSITDAFVIYRDGRLISHRKSDMGQKSELDGDLVSAMLTAVQEFITDSLSDDKTDRVKKLEFGDKELYFERGSVINLVVIYSGSMNRKLKTQVEALISKIEDEHPFLSTWDGRMTQLADVNVQLDELITSWQTVKA